MGDGQIVTDRPVQRTVSGSVGWDTYSIRLCLLYPDGADNLKNLQGGSVDSQRLDHWRTVSWDTGITDSRALLVVVERMQQKVVCSRAEISAVCKFWSRILEGWTTIFMTLRLWTWEMCRNHLFSTLSQQWPPVVISHMGWRQQELEGMRAAAKQRFRQSRPSSCVYVGSGLSVICIGMWRDFIWTWPSCGGAQCRGAPCGRARPRTAWITFEWCCL